MLITETEMNATTANDSFNKLPINSIMFLITPNSISNKKNSKRC